MSFVLLVLGLAVLLPVLLMVLLVWGAVRLFLAKRKKTRDECGCEMEPRPMKPGVKALRWLGAVLLLLLALVPLAWLLFWGSCFLILGTSK
ncbi:MAG: hypothetical protein FWF96_05635 [Kiritimatiellaeota bacterium]|nr:hypothetical protein [Kiritimatiellota bacterium]